MVDSIAGRSLTELYKEHAAGLADFRTRLGPGDEEDQVLLRLLLSEYGNVEAAEIKAKQAREDRLKYAKVLEKAKAGEHLPQESTIRQNLCFGRWEYPGSTDYPPLLITRSGLSNAKALMESVTVEQLVEYFLWERQRAYVEVCQASKAKDQLILMISVNDLDNASIITGREPLFFEAVKVSSETAAGLFPLLTRKHIMVNSGFLLDTLYYLVSSFLPQRVLDKVAFMSCSELTQTMTDAGVPSTSFPDFLGGSCSVPPNSPLFVKS